MESITKFYDPILYVVVIVFPVTTLMLIRVVKKEKTELVSGAVSNPILPNLDLRFFSKLQGEYRRITGKNTLAVINKLSFWLTLVGLFLNFIVPIIIEFISFSKA